MGRNVATLAWILFILAMLGLSSCAHERVDPAYLALVDQQHEIPLMGELGPGDKFNIRVFGEEGLTGEFIVSADGTMNYPHVGRFEVSGMTCADVEETITHGLQQGFVRRPAVSCTILEYNSKQIFVFGEVR